MPAFSFRFCLMVLLSTLARSTCSSPPAQLCAGQPSPAQDTQPASSAAGTHTPHPPTLRRPITHTHNPRGRTRARTLPCMHARTQARRPAQDLPHLLTLQQVRRHRRALLAVVGLALLVLLLQHSAHSRGAAQGVRRSVQRGAWGLGNKKLHLPQQKAARRPLLSSPHAAMWLLHPPPTAAAPSPPAGIQANSAQVRAESGPRHPLQQAQRTSCMARVFFMVAFSACRCLAYILPCAVGMQG